jgi:hypothetical protein
MVIRCWRRRLGKRADLAAKLLVDSYQLLRMRWSSSISASKGELLTAALPLTV